MKGTVVPARSVQAVPPGRASGRVRNDRQQVDAKATTLGALTFRHLLLPLRLLT